MKSNAKMKYKDLFLSLIPLFKNRLGLAEDFDVNNSDVQKFIFFLDLILLLEAFSITSRTLAIFIGSESIVFIQKTLPFQNFRIMSAYYDCFVMHIHGNFHIDFISFLIIYGYNRHLPPQVSYIVDAKEGFVRYIFIFYLPMIIELRHSFHSYFSSR